MNEKFMKIALDEAKLAYDAGDVPVGAVEDISLRVAAGSSLTFGGRVVSSGGELLVNDGHETGRTVLEGVGSAFKNGITHRGGMLEATSAEVFGDVFDERKFRFKG